MGKGNTNWVGDIVLTCRIESAWFTLAVGKGKQNRSVILFRNAVLSQHGLRWAWPLEFDSGIFDSGAPIARIKF